MKRFTALFILALILMGGIFVLSNIYLKNSQANDSRYYLVEANRISVEIQEKGYNSLDLSKYKFHGGFYE